jgi:hypothetical protein
MLYLIEDPSSFAPIEVWHEHLRQLRKLPQDDEGVRLAVEWAERHIAEEEKREKERRERSK